MVHETQSTAHPHTQRQSDIIAFIANDRRSQEEILTSIKERIERKDEEPLPEKEASEATHRLLGFIERAVDNLPDASDKVDFQKPRN